MAKAVKRETPDVTQVLAYMAEEGTGQVKLSAISEVIASDPRDTEAAIEQMEKKGVSKATYTRFFSYLENGFPEISEVVDPDAATKGDLARVKAGVDQITSSLNARVNECETAIGQLRQENDELRQALSTLIKAGGEGGDGSGGEGGKPSGNQNNPPSGGK